MSDVLTNKEIDELLQSVTSANLVTEFINGDENNNTSNILTNKEIDTLLSEFTKNE